MYASTQGGRAAHACPPVPLTRGSSPPRSGRGAVTPCIGHAENVTQRLRSRGWGERESLDVQGSPAQRTRYETRGEREEPDVERPAAGAALNAREIEGQRRHGRAGVKGMELGEKGATRRPTFELQRHTRHFSPARSQVTTTSAIHGDRSTFISGPLQQF